MATMNELHSRSILAGYDPALLSDARVLVVGLGALGQNVVQNLALVGVGNLLLIDFDEFIAHNATRSPLYPTQRVAREFGMGKATVVAHNAAAISTAERPACRRTPTRGARFSRRNSYSRGLLVYMLLRQAVGGEPVTSRSLRRAGRTRSPLAGAEAAPLVRRSLRSWRAGMFVPMLP